MDLIERQAAIDVNGLDEEIRCEMCKNPMHTNRGCDGNCRYDEKLYKKIIQILDKRITPLPSAQPDSCEFYDTESHFCALHRPSAKPYSEADIQKMQDLEQAEIQKAYELGKLDAESRWIPTKAKPDPDLPEDDMSGYFLVTLHTYGNIGFDMDEYEVKKMRWDRVNGWVLPVHSPAWIEEALTQDVLAWKPCPEPYREDGAE